MEKKKKRNKWVGSPEKLKKQSVYVSSSGDICQNTLRCIVRNHPGILLQSSLFRILSALTSGNDSCFGNNARADFHRFVFTPRCVHTSVEVSETTANSVKISVIWYIANTYFMRSNQLLWLFNYFGEFLAKGKEEKQRKIILTDFVIRRTNVYFIHSEKIQE